MAYSLIRIRILLAFGIVLGVAVIFWNIYSSNTDKTTDLTSVILSPELGMNMEGVHLFEKKNNDNVLEIKAEMASISADESSTELTNFTLISHSQDSGPVTIVARKGVINNKTENMTVTGNVLVRDSKGRALITDTLHWNSFDEQISTDDQVWIFGDRFTVRGRGMLAEMETERVTIMNDVTATFRETK